ncbi:MAG: lysozyme [Lysobacterales bacterium]
MAAVADPVQRNVTEQLVGGSLLVAMLLAALLIQPWEGRVLKPYRDIVGVLTVCDGHTGGVEQRTYTDADCDQLFASDLGEAWRTVARCYTGPMTEHQAAALMSLAFRVGPGGKGVKDGVCWLKSGRMPTIRVAANEGRWEAACAQFDDWVYAGGVRVRGLVRRAAAERKLCEGRI